MVKSNDQDILSVVNPICCSLYVDTSPDEYNRTGKSLTYGAFQGSNITRQEILQ